MPKKKSWKKLLVTAKKYSKGCKTTKISVISSVLLKNRSKITNLKFQWKNNKKMNTPKPVQDLRRQTMQANSPNTPLRRRSNLNVTNVNSTSLVFFFFFFIFYILTLPFRSTMMRQNAEILEYLMELKVTPVWRKCKLRSRTA